MSLCRNTINKFFPTYLLIILSIIFMSFKNKNKSIVFGPGEHEIDSPIILKSGDSLIGNKTVLRLKDNSNCPVIIIGDLSENPIESNSISVSGISIDGNMSNQTSEYYSKADFIRNNGILIRHSSNVLIENVKIYNCRSGGIVSEKHCKEITIRDSVLSKNFFDGLACYETTKSLFINLICEKNNAAGM